jgi:inhibitor of KinA sporulation pathway (predicted exonuclease)
MFNKDILIVDIEASGLDAERYELIQLAAIQLDKKTLKPKQEFASYIRPKKWKTLSRELHPDKHKGDKQKEAKFKEVNEAYDVLSDAKKKQAYDQFGSTDGNPFGGGFGGGNEYLYGNCFTPLCKVMTV